MDSAWRRRGCGGTRRSSAPGRTTPSPCSARVRWSRAWGSTRAWVRSTRRSRGGSGRRSGRALPSRQRRGGGRQAGAGEGRVLPETRGPAGRRRQGGPPRSVPVMEGLIAQGLVKRFRNRLVGDGVSLATPRGEVGGLLG